MMEITANVTITEEDLEDPIYDVPCQDVSYDPDYKRERIGNNRYHVPKSVAKAKRKAAKIARRKNRK